MTNSPPDRVVEATHSLDSGVERVWILDLARDRARVLVHELERAIDLACATHLDLVLYGTPDRAGELVRTLARAVDRDLGRARAVDLDRACDRAAALEGDLDRIRTLLITRNRELSHELDFSCELAREIQHLITSAVSAVPAPGQLQGSTQLARRLLMLAVQLLPSAERDRYFEEFRSELSDIARAGGNRRVQVAYAARQATSAVRLRSELRVPRRRAARPPRRRGAG